MRNADWDIRRAGRAWTEDEADQRWELTPEKLEMIHGKILWEEDERIKLLGLLLENVKSGGRHPRRCPLPLPDASESPSPNPAAGILVTPPHVIPQRRNRCRD
jgi:hypothetical protein